MRTLKKKYISSMLIFTLLMAAFMPITSFARTVAPMGETAGENGLDHFSLSSDGLLTWTTRSTRYDKVRLLDATGKLLDHEDIDVNSSSSPVTNSKNIINWMDSLHLDTGRYTIMVHPWFGGSVGFGLEDYIYYDYTSPYEKLEAPVNLRWDGKTAKWDENSKATSYLLNIYDESGNKVVSGVSTSATSYSYSSAVDGYWFEVKAKSNSTSPIYRDSNYNESPRYTPTQLTSVNAILSPTPAVGLTIGDLAIAPEDSSKYTISSYYWKLNDSGMALASTTKFEAGQTYTLYLTFSENSEYIFSDDVIYNVNGNSTVWTGFEATENRKISFTIPASSILKGDMNKDNYVNSTDAALVLDRFKNNDATEEDFARGNMNGDNVLNSTDAAMILDVFKNS